MKHLLLACIFYWWKLEQFVNQQFRVSGWRDWMRGNNTVFVS